MDVTLYVCIFVGLLLSFCTFIDRSVFFEVLRIANRVVFQQLDKVRLN